MGLESGDKIIIKDNIKEKPLKQFTDIFKLDGSFCEYLVAVRNKLTENLLSVKVWFFLWPFIMSTGYLGYIMYQHLTIVHTILAKEVEPETLTFVVDSMKNLSETFIGWCTFNVSLGGTVIVVREQFKVEKIRALNTGPEEVNPDIERINS